MKKPRLVKVTCALALAATTASLAWGHDVNSKQEQWHAPTTLAGVWRVTRHGVNCATGAQLSTFPVLMTFHEGGTLSSDGLAPGPVPVYAPAEHGLWQQRPGFHSFSFRVVDYSYDADGIVSGSQEITATGQLTSSNSFTYTSSITFYDVDGNALFSVCGRATGLRFF